MTPQEITLAAREAFEQLKPRILKISLWVNLAFVIASILCIIAFAMVFKKSNTYESERNYLQEEIKVKENELGLIRDSISKRSIELGVANAIQKKNDAEVGRITGFYSNSNWLDVAREYQRRHSDKH